MTEPFVNRLRGQLLEGGPRYRRRQRVKLATISAVMAVALVGIGVVSSGRFDQDGLDVATAPDPDAGQTDPRSTSSTTGADTSTTVEPDPEQRPAVDRYRAEVAIGTVDSFLARLRANDIDGAAEFWTGYPVASPDDAEVITRELIRFRQEHEWMLSPEVKVRYVTPSFAWTVAAPVVTVVSESSPVRNPPAQAAAFVLSDPAMGADRAIIERLAETASESTPRSGSTVQVGDRIVMPGMPIEGGAVAHIGDVEIPAVVDHDSMTTSVVIPDWASGQIVLTVSMATPELPGADAFVFDVAEAAR